MKLFPQKFLPKNKLAFCFLLLVFLSTLTLAAQVDFDALNAQERFREGIVRFHRGSYNEAILNFQRSLNFVPEDPLVRQWLGRAYYFSGFEEAALNEWQRLESEGEAADYLRAFIDHVIARQSLADELREDREFLVVERFQSEEYPNTMTLPVGVIPDGRGRIVFSSFGTNNLGILDQSGRLLTTYNGGFGPLSGPFDTILQDSELFVSNFTGDYISVLDEQGNTIRSFGETGIGDGQLIGPQYMSISDEPALYVSDFGNQRIVKFTLEGEFLFHFGSPPAFRNQSSEFSGFQRIGGLLAREDGIYVADNPDGQGILYRFDVNGNLLERLQLPGVENIQSLKPGDLDDILVTSRTAVYRLSPGDLQLSVLYEPGGQFNSQFVSATFDDNNNLLISDFRNSELLYLSRLSGIYSGYRVELLRIEASQFPRLSVEVSVRDILGNDILGLEEENFVLTEEGLPFDSWRLEYSGSFDEFSTAAFILEASSRMDDRTFRSRQQSAVTQALENLPGQSSVRLYSAGISPVLEWDRNDNSDDFAPALQSIGADPEWRLDQAIRLAGDRLLLDQAKREIVFVGSGSLPSWAFENIGLSETLAYLNNNHIRFSIIQSADMALDPAIDFLIRETGGMHYSILEPRGLTSIQDDFLRRRTGIYLLSTNSLFDPDFGRKYLPIEVEVSHFTKSGRDESGYFGPLEF